MTKIDRLMLVVAPSLGLELAAGAAGAAWDLVVHRAKKQRQNPSNPSHHRHRDPTMIFGRCSSKETICDILW